MEVANDVSAAVVTWTSYFTVSAPSGSEIVNPRSGVLSFVQADSAIVTAPGEVFWVSVAGELGFVFDPPNTQHVPLLPTFVEFVPVMVIFAVLGAFVISQPEFFRSTYDMTVLPG
jgi:hypothetical protein